MSVSDQLREAIENYGSQYRVAKDSGVAQQVIQRFMARQRSLHLETVDRLANFLGMRLTRPTTRPKRRGRQSSKRN